MGGIDDFMRQMLEDELAERAEHHTKLSPIEYARLRNIVPQRVYYFIRNNRLQLEHCICGRKVVDIAAADKLFGFFEPIQGSTEADEEDESSEEGESSEEDESSEEEPHLP